MLRLSLFSSELLLVTKEEKCFTYGQDIQKGPLKVLSGPQKQRPHSAPVKLPPAASRPPQCPDSHCTFLSLQLIRTLPLCAPSSSHTESLPGVFPKGLSGAALCHTEFLHVPDHIFLILTPVLHLLYLLQALSPKLF